MGYHSLPNNVADKLTALCTINDLMPADQVKYRFDEALRQDNPYGALTQLARDLKREGMSQLDMYRLYDGYLAKLEHEDSPQYNAVLDTMDWIVGWGNRANWIFDQGLDRSLYDKAFMKPQDKE